ncbi:hypothetical protein B0T20DRAFT_500268 [Sordaria brevicollis]|uniref:Uncharacterized protein n=1 Tax=Sordaria brevicollis TaxID=83679 RepID=A0AAE0UAG2_SORBR|nr:hypothetical protein B0T20DRAFT_500268 [Sordaria brevicollis]
MGTDLVPSSGTAVVQMTPNVTYHGFNPSLMAENAMAAFRNVQSHHSILFHHAVCDNCTLNSLGFGWKQECVSFGAGLYDLEGPHFHRVPVFYPFFRIKIEENRTRDEDFINYTLDVVGRTTEYNRNHVPEFAESYQTFLFGDTGSPSSSTHVTLRDNRLVHLGPGFDRDDDVEHLSRNGFDWRRSATSKPTALSYLATRCARKEWATWACCSHHTSTVQSLALFGSLMFSELISTPQPWSNFYDPRLELFTRAVRDKYETNFGTVSKNNWLRFGEDVKDPNHVYRSHIASYCGKNPETPEDAPRIPVCEMTYTSPMDSVLNTFRDLAMKALVSAALHGHTHLPRPGHESISPGGLAWPYTPSATWP